MSNQKNHLVSLSELLFTVLPVIIISIIFLFEEKYGKLFYNTEWAICAIILFGQSIVKFSSGTSNSQKRFTWQKIALIITLIIVLGLIPSIIFLVINILHKEEDPSFFLHMVQIIWALLSGVVFFYIGGLGQKFLEEKN
ncbi:hypothetical protein FUAX_17840 [Fulvitalea axinellae]|uniref:Uncharacterized protein n=1 Tax=Fulvitalea axinellae TaxID=1182444 RepID=A0AAU9CV79_9BACT|nr:hypothetical protein FUAX_17840 [Fulvitalea axinellae]